MDMNTHIYRKGLMAGGLIIFSVFMSIPFLVPKLGFFALFGIIPLLFMEKEASEAGLRRFWLWHYGAFVLWNSMTTFWICNATIGGGLFAIFANAMQMSVVFGLFRLSKKVFKGVLPYIFLAAMWIAWERAYFSAQISWPWLVLGNSFAGSVRLVQWYEYTGVLGGSLWVWAVNLGLFGILSSIKDEKWRIFNIKAKMAALASLVSLICLPVIISLVIYSGYEEKECPLDVLIVQPNIDPYQKFQALSQNEQNNILLRQIEEALKDRGKEEGDFHEPLLVLAPETFTNDVLVNNIEEGDTFTTFKDFLQSYPNVNLLFGAASYSYYFSDKPPSYNARKIREDAWVESHNSALITDKTGRSQIFHKSKLVLGVELTPYPAFFTKVDDLLGGVMGRCVGQKEISLLDFISYSPDGQAEGSFPIGSAICYESVYGEYCTGYIKKGARLLVVITNDAWWGDTPGYKQHLHYASLRAIETRRSIARCGNTGISAFINQRGDIVSRTKWWEEAVLRGKINLNDKMTFFAREGDIAGRISTFVFFMLFLAMAVRFITGKGKSLK